MQAYRIEVGREHGATPRDIVGAIANEANLSSKFIGNIKLMPNFSVVELPADMPTEVQQQLKQTRIRNQQLDLKVDPRGGEGVGRDDRPARPRRDGGRDGGGRGRGGEGHRGQRDGGRSRPSNRGSRD
jgi:ATP-dependent RNA helicase DeaD